MDPRLQHGIDLFNRREFFVCHEVLEEIWTHERGPRRLFLQAVIHFAVAFYHDQRGNPVGATRQLRKGLRKLAPTCPQCEGIDTAQLYRDGLGRGRTDRDRRGARALSRRSSWYKPRRRLIPFAHGSPPVSSRRRRAAVRAAGAGNDLLRRTWSARWIAVPDAPPDAYGVYHFRRTFDLPAKPQRFVVHVSGDNRYQLFVNGRRVAWGPARGDLFHWRYETVDLAPYLRSGTQRARGGRYGISASSRPKRRSRCRPDSSCKANGGRARRRHRPGVEVRAQRGLCARSRSPAGRCAGTTWPAPATA